MADISLLINSQRYGGWTSASVDLSIENLSGTFNLILTDIWAGQTDPVVIHPTDSCQVIIEDQTVITGYVDVVNLTIDASSHSIQITGRDKAADIIDCSAVEGTGQFTNLLLEEIIGQMCKPFGIPVSLNVDTGKPFVTFNVEQGVTVYECIQKLAIARQCLVISDGQGGIQITRASSDKAGIALVEGINILSGTATYDYSLRFSKYIVKGQLQGTDNLNIDATVANLANSQDSGVVRYRPLVVVADGQATKEACQQRADWELTTRVGRSRRFTIAVQGWLQEFNGALWAINQLVYVQSKILGVDDVLLVVGINFKLDENGQITTLTLTSRNAYEIIPNQLVDPNQNPFLLSSAQGDEY